MLKVIFSLFFLVSFAQAGVVSCEDNLIYNARFENAEAYMFCQLDLGKPAEQCAVILRTQTLSSVTQTFRFCQKNPDPISAKCVAQKVNLQKVDLSRALRYCSSQK